VHVDCLADADEELLGSDAGADVMEAAAVVAAEGVTSVLAAVSMSFRPPGVAVVFLQTPAIGQHNIPISASSLTAISLYYNTYRLSLGLNFNCPCLNCGCMRS
jgi:hypothetical protein